MARINLFAQALDWLDMGDTRCNLEIGLKRRRTHDVHSIVTRRAGYFLSLGSSRLSRIAVTVPTTMPSPARILSSAGTEPRSVGGAKLTAVASPKDAASSSKSR